MIPALELIKGPAAGVATSVLWTGTSVLFTGAGKRLGAVLVNSSRIAMAIVLLAVTHRVSSGTWIPDAHAEQLLFLALSGIVGLAIGDQALFVSFVLIGPRLAMLCMTTAPLFAALFAWAALGETLTPLAFLGMILTVGGVAWVVLERPHPRLMIPTAHRRRGVILGLAAAACQAGGLLLSKQGIGHGSLPESQHLPPLAATYLRMVFAGLGVLPILVVHALRQRQLRRVGVRPKRIGSPAAGWLFTVGGAVFGPFLGVWMSLVAANNAPVGVAQTLCSLPPVFILPYSHWVQKEHVSRRAVLGAIIAVAGSALLFLPAG